MFTDTTTPIRSTDARQHAAIGFTLTNGGYVFGIVRHNRTKHIGIFTGSSFTSYYDHADIAEVDFYDEGDRS